MINNKKRHLFWFILIIATIFANMQILPFTINGNVKAVDSIYVPQNATIYIREVDPIPGGSYIIEPIPLGSAKIDTNGDFLITFTWPSATTGFEVGDPDLIFYLTQDVDGGSASYEEEISETRWNVTDGTVINLAIDSDDIVFTNPTITTGSIPVNDVFVFTRIGKYETANMDCMGSDPLSTGYLNARRAPYSFTGTDSDIAFGSTMDLFAWFGKSCNIDYYKVQYSSDGGSTWNDISTSLPNKWYDTSDPNPLNWKWRSQSMGPFNVDGINNLYTVPYFVRPDTTWSFLDRVGIFESNVTNNGLIRIRIEAYKESGGSIILASSSDLTIAPNHGEIVLNIDNIKPNAEIMQIDLNGTKKNPCEIINFGAGDNLNITFRVWDQNGHLKNYVLYAMYGHNQIVASPPTGSSQGYGSIASGPLWNGYATRTITYNGSIFDSSKMLTCAYQFRLDAYKRTTNGYNYIYWDEDTWHIAIQR